MILGRYFERLYFRKDQIDLVLDELGKTAETVAYDWAPPDGKSDPDFPPAPGRSTSYNWKNEGFPSINKYRRGSEVNPKFYQAVAACGQIDVDPLAVFDLERNGFASRFSKLRKAIQHGLGGLGAYAPLFELYEPDEVWPSSALAKRFWGRDWFAHVFSNENEYQSDDYGLVKIRFTQAPENLPRAVHIAYRRWDTRDQDTMWRFYGTVRRVQNQVELFNEGGVHQLMKRRPCCDLEFRTFFGGRKVEFKIASLHQFETEIVFPCNDMGIVGFNW
jgi:hypothetical protein